MSQELKFIIRFEGGEAENHRLNLYYAAKSMHGLARALAISTHALVSNGEIRHRVDTIPDVEFYMYPGQKGSFIEVVSVIFSDPAVQSIGTSVLGAAFWDMINFSWRHATGTTPETSHTRNKKIIREKDEFANEISDALEKPMQDLHSLIQEDHRIKIQIKKPKGEVIIELNVDTYNFVSTQDEGTIQKDIYGNVTKINIISGYGRFYDVNREKTIPFHLSKQMTTAKKGILTTSLHDAGQTAEGKIHIDARVILNRLGQVKRLIIFDARTA